MCRKSLLKVVLKEPHPIYLDPILKWQPWILKKTYLFPFITIAMTLAHELDHHVNRNNHLIDREKSAEKNMFNYIYPSIGIFRPILKFLHYLSREQRTIG